jgi:hypothetical protein
MGELKLIKTTVAKTGQRKIEKNKRKKKLLSILPATFWGDDKNEL